MSIQVYALRHVETDSYMPATMGRRTRGWSWWEPVEIVPTKNIRIFFTLRSAQNARTAWVHGPYERKVSTSSDFFGNFDDWDETLPVEPPCPRAIGDLEIVEFNLTEAGVLP